MNIFEALRSLLLPEEKEAGRGENAPNRGKAYRKWRKRRLKMAEESKRKNRR